MVRAVHGEDELINDVRSGGRTVELIRAIYRSAKTREKILISYDT
jgi:hypothetical protein